MSLFVHPETCAVVGLELGTYVGKLETKSTLLEVQRDARYHRHDQRSPTVTRFSGLDSARRALQVREDELLSAGSVRVDGEARLVEVLAEHDPWKSWRRAQASPVVLTELWKGLAPLEQLERASAGVSVAAIRTEAVVLSTPRGRLACERPLAPDELGDAPVLLLPLLVRHASMGGSGVGFLWDPAEGVVLGADDVEFSYLEDEATLLRTDSERQVVVPATASTVMTFVLERFFTRSP